MTGTKHDTALGPKLKPCVHCGGAPTVERDGHTTICCTECYDYCVDTGATPATLAWGTTTAQAVENWNEMVEDYLDEHGGAA